MANKSPKVVVAVVVEVHSVSTLIFRIIHHNSFWHFDDNKLFVSKLNASKTLKAHRTCEYFNFIIYCICVPVWIRDGECEKLKKKSNNEIIKYA